MIVYIRCWKNLCLLSFYRLLFFRLSVWSLSCLRPHQECRHGPLFTYRKVCSLIQLDNFILILSFHDNLSGFQYFRACTRVPPKSLKNAFVILPSAYLAIALNHLTSLSLLWICYQLWLRGRDSCLLLQGYSCCLSIILTLIDRFTFFRVSCFSLNLDIKRVESYQKLCLDVLFDQLILVKPIKWDSDTEFYQLSSQLIILHWSCTVKILTVLLWEAQVSKGKFIITCVSRTQQSLLGS